MTLAPSLTMSKLNSTMFDGVNRLERTDVIRFRCTLESHDARDVHREFSGTYFPRWHAFYLEEARFINGIVKLNPAYPFDTYENEKGERFMAADFQVGNRIVMSTPPTNQRDDVARTFVIVVSDYARLYTNILAATLTMCKGTAYRNVVEGLPQSVIDDVIAIRDGFIRQAGVVELGLKAVGQQFRSQLDSTGHRLVSQSTLERALKQSAADIPLNRVPSILAAFPAAEVAGTILLEDLLEVMRGPMSEGRKAVVQRVFQQLDYDGDSAISVNEIRAKFAAGNHPEVRNGALTAQQVMTGFLATWEARGPNEKVTYAEFVDYYSGLSAIISDDATFETVVRSAWRILA